MKKIALVVVLFAVLVGIVFGGLSIASAAPSKPPPTSGPVYMQTLASGPVHVGNGLVVKMTYPGVRHVSLTVGADVTLPGDEVDVAIFTNGGYATLASLTFSSTEKVLNCQFDASSWEIVASLPIGAGLPLVIGMEYDATVTYYPGS
jgi:hypothetical protein